jgi:serine/threonine protein kinase/predicted esterase
MSASAVTVDRWGALALQRGDMSGAPDAVQSGDAPEFEALLALCIDAQSEGDSRTLQRLFAENPSAAPRLQGRLAELERLGLLGSAEKTPEEIAGHRILTQLGRGGMGSVFLAEERASGRRVALKLASLHLEDGDAGRRARARFEREIHAIAQLAHPWIVGIRASGEHEGRPWFSMEHVDGALLARLIERLRARGVPPSELSAEDARAELAAEMAAGPVPSAPRPADGEEPEPWTGSYVEWSCRVVRDLASALAHAHAQGVVHRDVKPSNVLVRPDGRALLFDFGLAHVQDQPTLTRSGDFAGTPYAVAPEQVDARRGSIESRTDVWGLGVVLYELLALRRPFEGAGAPALLRRVLEGDPLPLRRLHPGLPRALEHVSATALEKAQRRRYPSARALGDDLDRFLRGEPVRARGASARRRVARFVARRPAAASGIGLAALIAVGLPAGLLAANAVVRGHARRAERAAAEAQSLARANAEVVGYLVELFEPLEATGSMSDDGAIAMLEAQAQRLQGGLGEEPLARAALLAATGTVFANLGQPVRARPLFDRALAIRQSELGELHPDTVGLIVDLARVSVDSGEAAAALGLCARARDALGRLEESRPALSARLAVASARALCATGQCEAAASELETALDALSGAGLAEGHLAADVLEESARVELERGRHSEARARCECSLALRRAEWLPDPRALAAGLELLAQICRELSAAEDADTASAKARALRAAVEISVSSAPLAPELALSDPTAPEFDLRFQSGITALQAQRFAEAREHFERCLDLRPSSAVCMYNIACAHARAGELEQALTWIERAAQHGFGMGGDSLVILQRDADLVPLRAEPRFQDLTERLAEQGARFEQRLRTPAVYEPPSLERERAPPLLVVLHTDGDSPDGILQGEWPRVADQLGCLLIAPCAPRPLGTDPQAGFAWIEDLSDFAEQPWRQEAACADALTQFLAERAVDRERVLAVGEGSGALVAFDLGLRAPGLVRGVLLVQGPAFAAIPPNRPRTAAALGLRARGLFDPAAPIPWLAQGVGAHDYGNALSAWLAGQGLDGSVEALPSGADERARALADAVQRFWD